MWIDFNEMLFKTEDVIYVDKYVASEYGSMFYALKVKTTYTEIIKTYSRNSVGYAEREEDYETLYKQLKEG